MTLKYIKRNTTIDDVNEDMNSMYHHMLNIKSLIGDMYLRIRNLESFMNFAEIKFEELSKKD